MEKMKEVGFLWGGLDSWIAAALVKSQSIEVKAVNFYTGFCTTDFRRQVNRRKAEGKVYYNESLKSAAALGIEIEYIDISASYIPDVLMKPKHGYGSAINPCLDCRTYMLGRARIYMEEVGAQFVFTGEVLGQRPMSQYRKALDVVAEEMGVSVFSQPAGGCCSLADENYAKKMRDLLDHLEAGRIPTLDDVILLKVGRHFRPAKDLKVVVGRDEVENRFLERYAENG